MLISSNQAWKTAFQLTAQMDLFDWIEIISTMKKENYTQQDIADRIGWTRKRVADFYRLLDSIVPSILTLAKNTQAGRGTDNVPNGTFNFTEGWFRGSRYTWLPFLIA